MAKLKIYCDFDGTITVQDVTDLLLDGLADPEWLEIEAAWQRGEIGSRECMGRQVRLIRGGWEAIEDLLAQVRIDPTFPDFVRWCSLHDIELIIVSEGLDKVIHHLMRRYRLKPTRVIANRLVEHPNGSLNLEFSNFATFPECSAGVCKCDLIHRCTAPRVVIGDGRSDFCWSQRADIVFAKPKLHAHCVEQKIPSIPFIDFRSIERTLAPLANSATREALLALGRSVVAGTGHVRTGT